MPVIELKRRRFSMRKYAMVFLIMLLVTFLAVPGYAKKSKPKKKEPVESTETKEATQEPVKKDKKGKKKVVVREVMDASFAISYDIYMKSFRSHTLQLNQYESNYFMPHPVGIQMKLSRDDVFMKIGLSIPTEIGYDTRGRTVSYGIYQSRTSVNYFSAGIFYQSKKDCFYYGFDFVKANFQQEITYSRYLYYQDPSYYGPGTVDLRTEIHRWNLVAGWSAKPTDIGIEFGINLATKISSTKQFGIGFPPNLYDLDFPVAYMRINLWL